jgi:hypothetical protein
VALTGVTFIDESAEKALTALFRRGSELIANGAYTRYVVHNIDKRKSNRQLWGKEYAVNIEELNWLLQTIKDAAIAARFVVAQYHCGRISLKVMSDVARERGWIN